MTSSTPVRPDPLAPTPPSSPAPVASSQEAPPSPQKKQLGRPLLLSGVLLLVLIAGASGAVALFLSPGSAPPAAVVAPPVPPDPGTPPPLPEFKVEQILPVPSDANQPSQMDLVKEAANRLPPQYLIAAGETAAPAEFIVRGGSLNDVAGSEVPNHERWSIRFPPGITIEAYTRQLDYFKIELGVLGGSPNVTYLSNLSNPKPQSRQASGNTEIRLYLIWNSGPLREADEILVTRAGINPEGKVIAHFVPQSLEEEMLRLEAEHAKTNQLTRIRRTVFGIQAAGVDAFQMVVLEQKGD
jgi:hypothetical protein